MRKIWRMQVTGLFLVAICLSRVGCANNARQEATAVPITSATPAEVAGHMDEMMLTLPSITAVDRKDAPLQVVATTSIIGDVVAQVGGDAIALTTLIEPGQDPHSFVPGARELTAVTEAHVIFINGWNLEENLVHDLQSIGEKGTLVPISANIEPIAFGETGEHEEEHEHTHRGADPHVWQSIQNVRQWVANIQQVLSASDPANRAVYEANAAAYLAELAELEEYAQATLATIPPENRILITNHDALAYFARDYDFDISGTVIPGASTLAETSATDLAALVETMTEQGICTIFAENTNNTELAAAVAAELPGCDSVRILTLYTDALGGTGSRADSYIGMFRANVETIVEGLR